MDLLEISEGDQQKATGHKTASVLRQYNQNAKAIDRITEKFNAHLNGRVEIEPSSVIATSDITSHLRELVAMKKEGLLTDMEFQIAKGKLLA
jgi:hypothetical protein